MCRGGGCVIFLHFTHKNYYSQMIEDIFIYIYIHTVELSTAKGGMHYRNYQILTLFS